MQPALVHSEFHIWFAIYFSVDYENLVFTIIGEPILLYDVAQSNDVGDGSLAEPNLFWKPAIFSLWVTTMVPPLLLSLIILLDLNVSVTSSGLQKNPLWTGYPRV